MHCFLGHNKNLNESIESLILIRKLLWIVQSSVWLDKRRQHGGFMAVCNIWRYKILLRVSCKASHCNLVLASLFKDSIKIIVYVLKMEYLGSVDVIRLSHETHVLSPKSLCLAGWCNPLCFTAACDQHGVNTLVIGDKLDDIYLVTVWLLLRIHKCVQANGQLSREDLTAQNELELWIYSACKTSAGINNWESKGLSVVHTSGTYGSLPAPYLPFLWKWSQLHSQIITHQAIKSHGWLERGEKV